jgi:hypothetical protein
VPSTDAFALKNSDLNSFLFADVGTELNGSSLTMLSVLARLGKDPWAEAAKWTNLPKAAAIDCLARSIGEMPLAPGTLANISATASRLILLLPEQTRTPRRSIGVATNASAIPVWVPIAFLCISLLMGLALSIPPASTSPARGVAPTTQAVDQTSTNGSQ